MTKTATLLIVDDDPFLLAIARIEMERKGYAVDTAINGQEALALMSRSDYDLVVTDINMPVMDGIEFLGKLAEKNTACKVLVVSADQYDKEQLLGRGATDFMIKSYDNDEMVRKIQHLINEG